MTDNVLHIENLTMQFGGVVAVDNFSMDVNKGEIVALIGPNGAGKTTAFNAVTGVYLPTAGRVTLLGENITGLRPDQITSRGIARTFQNIRLFSSMTVFENVLTAHHLRRTSSLFSATFRLNALEERHMREDTDALLKKVDLYDMRDEMAVSLPYGRQRMLEIVRALASQPKLLLLDEPAAGMNEEESLDLVDFVKKLHRDNPITILMIEHHMDVVSRLCELCTVLDFGKTLAQGTVAEVKQNEAVISAYLGGEL